MVGIGATESEFPIGNATNYDVFTTTAFDRSVGQKAATVFAYFVRLRHGAADLPRFTAALNALHPVFIQNQDTIATAVASSIHPQGVGWWVLALLAGLAGIAVIGQALGRQSVVESAEYPTLAALGLRRRHLLALGTARNVVVALAGAAGALVVAVALSPLTPVGEARLADPTPGVHFDPLVLPLGAVSLVVLVVALGIWPALRASRAQEAAERAAPVRPSALVAHLAAAGAPPTAVIGVRHALERGRGKATVPVGTALLGTMLAVVALTATTVFGASLSHLTKTPALYGDAYQLLISNTFAQVNPQTEISDLEHNPAVTGIMLGTRNEVSIKGVSVFAVAGQAVRGPLLLSSVQGRLPRTPREIDLGTTTLGQVGAHIGSLVPVTVQGPDGGTHTASFRVVGTDSFPGQFGLGGLGTGAAFTLNGYEQVACPPVPEQARCQADYRAGQPFAVLARTVPGPRGDAAVAHYVRKYFADDAKRPTVPTSLVNFGEAVNFPLILGVMLALFGAATLVHLLFVSVSRRRREIGLLRALGLVGTQVGATVCWQASTVAVVGLVVGVPAGIAVGGTVWRAFATNLGAVPVATTPLVVIAGLVVGVIVIANTLAFVPAILAMQGKPGTLLRTQ